MEVPREFLPAFFRADAPLRLKLGAEFHASPTLHVLLETPDGPRRGFEPFVFDWIPDDGDLLWAVLVSWKTRVDMECLASRAVCLPVSTDPPPSSADLPPGHVWLNVAWASQRAGRRVDHARRFAVPAEIGRRHAWTGRPSLYYAAIAFPIPEGVIEFDDPALPPADCERYVYPFEPDDDDLLWGVVISYAVLTRHRGPDFRPGPFRGLQDLPPDATPVLPATDHGPQALDSRRTLH